MPLRLLAPGRSTGGLRVVPPATVRTPPGQTQAPPGHGGLPPGQGGTPPGRTISDAGSRLGLVPVVTDPVVTAVVAIATLSVGSVPRGSGGFATPAFIQGNVNASGAGGGQQVAFLANVTAGNLLIAAINATPQAGKTLTGASDSQGNVYTVAGAIQAGWFGSQLAIFWAVAGTTGPCTVTFTTDGTGFQQYTAMTCHEISGINTGNPLRATAFGHVFPATTGADGATVGPLACGLNDYVFAYLGDDDTDNVAVGTGYTLREHQQMGSVRNGFTTEDRLAPAGGTITPTFTLTTADHIDLGAATFRPAPL